MAHRRHLLVALTLATCGAAPARPGPGPAPAVKPSWSNIDLVEVVDAFGPHTHLRANVSPNGAGFVVALDADGPDHDVLAAAKVSLFVADRRAIPGVLGPLAPIESTGGRPATPRRWWQHAVDFAWQGAALDEAIVEVDLGTSGRYWLELPFGFVRDPSTTPPAGEKRSTPKRPAAMATLAADDHVVPFRAVYYDLGVIQNGWRLRAILSNPFDAHAELELYRDDTKIGESMFRWGLHTPETSAKIAQHDGRQLTSMPMLIRLHDDGMRRSDHFHFNRSANSALVRGVGTFRATVADHVYEVTIPSSLYGYTQGTTDPYDTHRIVDAEHVLGRDLF